MPTRLLTEKEAKYFRKHYPTKKTEQLAKKMGYTPQQLKNYAARYKITKAPGYRIPSKIWTDYKLKKFIRIYPDYTSLEAMSKVMKISESMLWKKREELGLPKKPKRGFYEKGHTPANKGKKMSAEVYKKCKATMFKPGDKPKNTKPDGEVFSIRKQSNGSFRKFYKMADKCWEELQLIEWQKVNGPIPYGHVLACKSNNPLNCDPENWELLTWQENMDRNRRYYPTEMIQVIRTKNKLKKLIKEHEQK